MRFVSRGAECAFVIPTRNRCARLLATLTRYAEMTGPDVEVIVIDNASSDDTVPQVRERFDRVRLIALEKNEGMCARNHGASAAVAPNIFLLDDDSGPLPGAIESATQALRNPTLGAVACHVLLPDGSHEEGGSRHVYIGCGAVCRTSDLLAVGGYHPEYECYVDEYDVSYRIMMRGLAVRDFETCAVWHEPQARESFDYMVEKLLSNNGYLAAKFYPPDEAARFVAWIAYRYSVFAQQKRAAAGFRRGMELLPEKILRGWADRIPLPDAVLAQVLAHRDAAPAFAALARRGVRRIAFLRAGKEIPGLIRAAHEAGLRVEFILEKENGLLAQADRLFDIPVRPASDGPVDVDRIIVGGTSPGFIHNTLAYAKDAALPDVIAP